MTAQAGRLCYKMIFFTQFWHNMDIFGDWVFQLGLSAPIDLTVLAQNITDPNILGQMQKSFSHFVQTGQAWALLIGLAIGYMIRNLTSYG